MANVVAQGISRKQIRAFMKYVRELCGMTDRMYFPVVEFLEIILPNLIDDFTYEIVEHSEMPDKEGETIKYVEYKGTKYVVDGHHRLRAAKNLDWIKFQHKRFHYRTKATRPLMIHFGLIKQKKGD